MTTEVLRIESDALIVLAGPSGSGKSTWAEQWFRGSQIVSSDVLRGVVGEHVHDLRASTDAFEVLHAIVARRLKRGLLTVIDTLGMDVDRLDSWCAFAAEYGRPTHLIRFDTEPAICRRRNKARVSPVPAKVVTAQLATWAELKEIIGEKFGAVHDPLPARVVPTALLAPSSSRQRRLSFGLLISTFGWTEEAADIGPKLAQIAAEAEHAGFESIWVMDHFMQIPQVGREWDPMLESYTTLAFLAANTTRVQLGALVSCVTHRNIGHLGKIVATLDVLSQGRARCGLGLGWYEREHRAYGYEFPSVGERYRLLEDALEFLPQQWGSGAPAFSGRVFSTPEAIGYPRPIQDPIPILVGGSGEKRTLKLAAQHADACNLFGEPDVLAHKVAVLHDHCLAVDRDPATVEVTQLSNVLVASDTADLRSRLASIGGNFPPEQVAERTMAATVDEHTDRFSRIADAGVDSVMVSLADVGLDGAVANFSAIIDHFRP